jgi:hypothetical protein
MDAVIGNGSPGSPREFPEEAVPEITIRGKNERDDKSPEGNDQASESTIGKPLRDSGEDLISASVVGRRDSRRTRQPSILMYHGRTPPRQCSSGPKPAMEHEGTELGRILCVPRHGQLDRFAPAGAMLC